MMNEQTFNALLVLPRLRVQNANAISSPLTWGFPPMTAFIGAMYALERRMPDALQFCKVGVICHDFEAQATPEQGRYEHHFHLTRNPLDGSRSDETGNPRTAPIVEEGRAHLEITLVFGVNLRVDQYGENARAALAEQVASLVSTMRIAGGSVMPSLSARAAYLRTPSLELLDDDLGQREKFFRRMRRRWLPGFALVSRDDLLQERLAVLRGIDQDATVLDAWLSLLRLTYRASTDDSGKVEWSLDRRKGWLVPIPVGYCALADLNGPGKVADARDATTPVRFVESVYSVGQWISPHRVNDVNDILWSNEHDDSTGLYRCANKFTVPSELPL